MDENDGQEGAPLKPDILQKGDDYFYPVSQKLKTSPKTIMIAFLGCNCLYGLFVCCGRIESFPVRGIVLDASLTQLRLTKELLKQFANHSTFRLTNVLNLLQ